MAQQQNEGELVGRVAIVTGGGTGIGAASARVLAAAGADLVLAARKMDRLEDVAAEIRSLGRRCVAVQTDMRNEDEIDALVARTIAEFGRIDIVVNNAGGSYLFPLESTPLDKWDNNFTLNVRAPFILTQRSGVHMLAAGHGVFVNISCPALVGTCWHPRPRARQGRDTRGHRQRRPVPRVRRIQVHER